MNQSINRELEYKLDQLTEIGGAIYLLELFTTKQIDYETYDKYMKVINERAERVKKYGVKG